MQNDFFAKLQNFIFLDQMPETGIDETTFINAEQIISKTLHRFDELDLKLLYELTKDASISVPSLSKKLGINASVLYSRIKRLGKKKLIKKIHHCY